MENASQAVNGSTTAEDLDRDEVLARAEIATLSVMFTVTVVGNFAVLLVLSARPRKKLSRMYYFILHLSIADLCTAFLSILPQLAWDVTYRFRGGPIMCKVVKYGQTLGPYLSAYILMVTALDRYQAVCHPLAYCSWTSRRSKFMLVVFSYQEIGPNVFDCWATFIQPWGERTYVTW
ncbi:Vasopressin V1a receptor [Blattella germanica]|nr:Vasopressin V1a receptor [Blattella germanica]